MQIESPVSASEIDRLEALQHVIRHLGRRNGVDDQRPAAAEQQRVAIGRRARDGGGSERAAGAAHILDDDGAEPALTFSAQGRPTAS